MAFNNAQEIYWNISAYGGSSPIIAAFRLAKRCSGVGHKRRLKNPGQTL
jgi:hypothetical protein